VAEKSITEEILQKVKLERNILFTFHIQIHIQTHIHTHAHTVIIHIFTI